MKWLIFFLLFSCGKHDMPSAVDNGDSDGDQIPDYQELGQQKYIADFEPIEELNGELSYSTSNFVLRDKILKFSNKRNLLSETVNLMTINKAMLKNENISFEWSTLQIENDPQTEKLADRLYTVRLKFATTDEGPQTVALIKDGVFKNLGDWKLEMNFSLTYAEMDSLLKKESRLAVGKKLLRHYYFDSQTVGSTVQEKTYRVYFSDGEKAKVLYVAKDLPFEQFKKFESINSTSNIDDLELFFSDYSEVSSWWERQLPNGDKVLIKAIAPALRESLLAHYQQSRGIISRENGVRQKSFMLKKKAAAKVYLNVRPTQQMRTFKLQDETILHMIGGGRDGSPDKWKCTYYYQSIESEFTIAPEISETLSLIKLRTQTHIFEVKELVSGLTVKNDQQGLYYQLLLDIDAEKLELFIEDRPLDTFVSTGLYNISCPRGYEPRGKIAVVSTNAEAKLSLNLEAFVENLE